jgi:RNA polymerase sigma factor (sigma-70 family)
MATPLDRRHLIVRAQAGDTAALGHLLAECQSDVRRYAMRHCLMSEVDDAVQEALLIVARHLGALKNASAFTGWLFTIVRRECARLARQMFGRGPLDDDRMVAALAQRSREDLRAELAFALESLPAHYLEMILLRDFEELTIAEICQRLGLSVAATKARLRRARLLVRDYLVGETDDAAAR